MPPLAMKSILGAIAFACFALKWAMDWRTDGAFGHGFTIFAVLVAALSLSTAVYEIAVQ